MRKLSRLWPAVAVALVLTQAIVALTVKPGPGRTAFSSLCDFAILFLATAAAVLNAYRSTRESRLFWSFIAVGCGLWSLTGWAWIYWEVLHRGSLDTRRLAQPLFLHIVPLMAAALTCPHRKQSGSKLYRATLNFLLLLFFWVFLYAYLVLPFVSVDLSVFNQRFGPVYILENIALLIALAVVVFQTHSPWRKIYAHLLGASLLYTVASTALNLTLIYGKYNSGGWLDVPVTAAYCWFLWIPLYGIQLAPQLQPTEQSDTRENKYLSMAVMLVVIAIPLIGVWELFRDEPSPQVHEIRLLAVLVSFVLMAGALFGKEYLANRELVDEISKNLRFSEERFYKAFNSSPEGITISTLRDGRYLEVNDAFLRIMEYERSELIGRTALDLGVWARPEERAPLYEELVRNGRVGELQAQFRTKSGRIRQVEVSAESIQLQSQECMLAITRDVTLHKQLEQRLIQAEKMEAVGRLAGGVAHDFNNMLGVIMGYSELLTRQLDPNSSLSRKGLAITTACQRAASLTAQLLAFSRRQVLQPKVLNLNSLVAETDQMLRRLIGEDVEAVTVLDSKLGHVKADPGQMVQVIMNLAVNARDAMPNGGKLIIETANVALPEGLILQGVSLESGRYVTLEVKDTGNGISAEMQGRIFEPFFTTKGVGEGTGLGLATVCGIVEQSGGHIFVESEVGKGTSFKIYLPCVDEIVEPSPIQNPLELQGSETILMVEDDPTLRDLVEESLQELKYNVLVAANGAEALRVLELSPSVDLLMTDVIMPHMSGPELAQLVSTLRPGIKVLYMSGYTDDKLRSVPSAGADVVWIQKPFQLQDLARKLREILNQRVENSLPDLP
jgi:PAS domain S-box-containing protein